MQIIINTESLSDLDRRILAQLSGDHHTPARATVTEKAPAPAKVAPAKAAPKVEPVVESEPDEDLISAAEDPSSGYTLQDAVDAATKLVSSGGAAKVKAALATVGAKRVSELEESAIGDFLAALDA